MFKQNNLIAGMLIGSLLPLITWLVFGYWLQNEDLVMDKPAVPYLIAVGLNLLLLRYCLKKDLDKTGNGVMMITFAFVLVIFIFKIHIR